MGQIQKQSILTTIISYLGVGLGVINHLFVYPKVLLSEEIGLYQSLVSFIILLSSSINLGFPASIVKYFPRLNEVNKNKLVSLSLFVPLVLPLIVAFLIYTSLKFNLELTPFNLKDNNMFLAFSVYLVSYMFVQITIAVQRTLFNISRITFFLEVVIRLLIFIELMAVYLKWIDFNHFIVISSFNYFVVIPGVFIPLLKKGIVRLRFKGVFQIPNLKEIIPFGIYSSLNSLSSSIPLRIDLFMIPLLLNKESALFFTGIYAISAFLTNVVEIPKRSIFSLFSSLSAKHLADKNKTGLQKSFNEAIKYNLILTSVLIICLCSNLEEVFTLMPNKETFIQGIGVVYIFSASKFIQALFGPANLVIINSDYYKKDLQINLFLSFLVIVLNYVFIPVLGIVGAALASLISILIYCLLRAAVLKYKLGIQTLTKSNLYISLLFILFIIIGVVINNQILANSKIQAFLFIILKSLFLGGAYVLLLVILNISPDFNKKINELRNKLLNYRLKNQ